MDFNLSSALGLLFIKIVAIESVFFFEIQPIRDGTCHHKKRVNFYENLVVTRDTAIMLYILLKGYLL
jgi:acyl-CoA thioesterase